MRIIKLTLATAIFLTVNSYPVYSQNATDPQQHLKIQRMAQMHGIHSDKLKDIMRRMIATLMKQPKDENDIKQQQDYLASLAGASRRVAAASETLYKFVPEGELTEEETILFKQLATALHDEALTGQAAAEQEKPDELNASLARFNKTCVDCHRLFREQ